MPGQVALGLMVNPKKPGQPSYPLYRREKQALIDSMARRARMIADGFNNLEELHATTQTALCIVFLRLPYHQPL